VSPTTDNSGAVQLSLFPVDEEESVLLAQGKQYSALPDVARKLVRAYLRAKAKGLCRKQSDWLRESGMPTSTAHDALKRHEGAIWVAITEASQLLCVRGAQDGALAIAVAGQRILEDLVSRRRSTADITPTERGLLQDCQVLLGLRLPGASAASATITLPDGTRVQAAAGSGPTEDGAAAVLASLRESVGRIMRAGAEADGADSVRGEVRALEAGDLAERDAEAVLGEVRPAAAVAVVETVRDGGSGMERVPETSKAVGFGSTAVAVLAMVLALSLNGSARALEGVGGGTGGLGRREFAAVDLYPCERTGCGNFSENHQEGSRTARERVAPGSGAPGLAGPLRAAWTARQVYAPEGARGLASGLRCQEGASLWAVAFAGGQPGPCQAFAPTCRGLAVRPLLRVSCAGPGPGRTRPTNQGGRAPCVALAVLAPLHFFVKGAGLATVASPGKVGRIGTAFDREMAADG
jgi:hypothetical protein